MSPRPELLRQGSQRRGRGFSIGFIGSTLRTSEDGGGIAVRFGIAGPQGRTTAELAAGQSAPLPGGGGGQGHRYLRQPGRLRDCRGD